MRDILKTKTVLYICPNAKRAGAEQVTALLAQHHQMPWKAQIYFLTAGPLVDELRKIGIVCHVYSGPRPRLKNVFSLFKCAREIAKIIKLENIELIHGVTGYGHIFGGIAAQLAHIPEIWFQHGPTGNLDWITGRIPTRLILVNSQFTYHEEKRFLPGFPFPPRIRVLYPATEKIDLSTYQDDAEKFRLENGILSNQIVIGLMGRIGPMKGHKIFLEAAVHVKRQYPSAKFLIVGAPFMPADEIYFEQIKTLAQSLGLEKQVHWAGFVPYPQYKALAACDILVNASATPEPFGLTLIEAMMLERCVIAPQAGGPLEIIDDGKTGLLFSAGSADDLAKKIIQVLSSDQLRQKMGQAARKTALDRFLISRMIEELESEYDRLLKEK